MSKVRAFLPPAPPPEVLVIDKQALFLLKDIAIKRFVSDKPQEPMIRALLALEELMISKGMTPNFKVKTE